jgi:DNA-binding GntR family transcriptional regulator
MAKDDPASPATKLARLAPLEPRTLADMVVDAIVEATATGVFLPGDRVVEAEVARALNVSRVPVREALRILESQGIVVNTRYRGMQLMDVNVHRLERILKVRTALESLAVEEVLALAAGNTGFLDPLADVVAQLHQAADKGDAFGVAKLDTEFHRTLCRLSGNDVLLRTWEPLSRQLTIIFGLSALQKELEEIAQEHDELLAMLRAGDEPGAVRGIREHILDYSRAIDYEGLVEVRRRERDDALRKTQGA